MKRTGPGTGRQTSRGSGLHGRTKNEHGALSGSGRASSAQPHNDGEVEDPDFRNVSVYAPINSGSSLRRLESSPHPFSNNSSGNPYG